MTTAAAFVEGGIQDSCDDSCSICLESFCANDPASVTRCNHEFHLQCVLEWSQRSSQCPMCCQNLALLDSSSQELLEAIRKEMKSTFYHQSPRSLPRFVILSPDNPPSASTARRTSSNHRIASPATSRRPKASDSVAARVHTGSTKNKTSLAKRWKEKWFS